MKAKMTPVRKDKDILLYAGLVLLLAVLAAVNVFLPQGDYAPVMPEQGLPAPRWVLGLVNAAIMLVIYGGLGLLGLYLSRKLGFAGILDPSVSHRQRFLVPLVTGIFLGLFIILCDEVFSRFHSLGLLPHPPFPTSLVASATAAIGEEIIFRLFFISFWVWLVSKVILKGKWQNGIFWIVTLFSAIAFGAGHMPSVMVFFQLESLSAIPSLLLGEIFLLNGVISVFAAYFFRKSGFLAAVGIHFWADMVWHVVWGLVG
ncbi:MAG TPA: CPBP family intramembrane metalloprotease [Bacteroidetes bacterium]|nr:CPBP family intramembrane metalloprotease [Bacteroidota bacterium]